MMDRARDELFSGARLADDQHRGIVVRDPLDHLKQSSHGIAAEDCLHSGQFQDHGFAIHGFQTALLRAECRPAE
jgi:hypothetical protein